MRYIRKGISKIMNLWEVDESVYALVLKLKMVFLKDFMKILQENVSEYYENQQIKLFINRFYQ